MKRYELFQGVYIHTPFCLQKCLYCDFPSYAGFSADVRKRYVVALCREIVCRSNHPEATGEIGHLTNAKRVNEDSNLSALGHAIEGTGTEDVMGNFRLEGEKKGADATVAAENATIYFGGGTPTTLSPTQIGCIVHCLKENGWWKEPAEATIEANPGTVTKADLVQLRQMGFDRISFGVQSFQEAELKALGRMHTVQQAKDAVCWAKDAGFARINIDLMSGIPGQTAASWQDTLTQALRLDTEHISAYSLILEAGTPLDALVARGQTVLPTEDETLRMYEMTTYILEENGLRRYEISNYARPGCESRHNMVYWHYEPYMAFGVGACAFTGQVRYTNTMDVETYLQYWENAERGCAEPVRGGNGLPLTQENVTFDDSQNLTIGNLSCRGAKTSMPDSGAASAQKQGTEATVKTFRETEPLSPEVQLAEAIIMGLRLAEGISLSEMQERFGVDILTQFGRELAPFFKKKMLARQGDRLNLTPYGMRFGNQVFEAFIP